MPLRKSFAKQNAAAQGFNLWSINDQVFSGERMTAVYHLRQGQRYRVRMRNASDDIHPIHLHRHSFELTKTAGKPLARVMKDVVMVGGYPEVEISFTADILESRFFIATSNSTWTLDSGPSSTTCELVTERAAMVAPPEKSLFHLAFPANLECGG